VTRTLSTDVCAETQGDKKKSTIGRREYQCLIKISSKGLEDSAKKGHWKRFHKDIGINLRIKGNHDFICPQVPEILPGFLRSKPLGEATIRTRPVLLTAFAFFQPTYDPRGIATTP
jgi:hypothetical protein